MPTFSILTPVYNVEKFLMGCAHSVLNQTYPDWELILVDDGSTDTSGKLCDQLASQYPDKIRVFHQKNQGQLAARNLAVSQARGKYYVFLDSDDALTPNALQTIYDTFQKYNCDCVIYEVQCITPQGNKLPLNKLDNSPFMADKHTLYRKVFLNNKYNSLCTKAARAHLLTPQDYSPYTHIKHGEDLLQSLQILKNCQKAVFIPDPLYLYMQNPTSVIHTAGPRFVYNYVELSQIVRNFIQQEQIFTPTDWQDFHAYYVSLLEERIKHICRLKLSWKEQQKLFNVLKDSAFYQEFLLSSAYKQPLRPLYTQFRLGLYRLLVWEVQCYDFFRNLLRR